MPIPDGLTPQSQRRVLLQVGEAQGWWVYESENRPGFIDDAGVEYDQITYTLRLPSSDEDDIVTLLADEVHGWVLAYAYQYGPDAVDAVRYRPGLPDA